MLTITNYNQSPNFGVRVKPAPKSPKIGKYFEKVGINTNRAMIGGLTTTAGAGAVSLARPDLISNPDFAKFGLVGGIAAVLGSMAPMVRTRKTDVAQNDTDMIAKAKVKQNQRNYEINDAYLGHIFLTQKGRRQYNECLEKIFPYENEINSLKQHGERHMNQAKAYAPYISSYSYNDMLELDCRLLSTDRKGVYNHYIDIAESYFKKATALEDGIREALPEWKKDNFKKYGELSILSLILNYKNN